MAHIVIVGALPESLVNFRGDFIRALVARGHRVTAMAANGTPECIASIEALGACFLPYPVTRAGRNIADDLRTFRALRRAFQKLRPDTVLAYTIKPVIWGGCAARALRISQFYALIEGLGYAFQAGHWRRRLVGVIGRVLYSIALRRAARVIFLNPDNKREFLNGGLIRKSQAAQIDGIGVDLDFFANTPLPSGRPSFLCVARLLGDKGLREYAAAAKQVRAAYHDVQISLLGPVDSSPDAIPTAEVKSWHDSGQLTYLGEKKDIRPWLSACSVYVLPSYHEGMPRTILEAMAMGRPIITTDTPGCRETVTPGENGYLVPKGSVEELAARMISFVEHPERCSAMGAVSRRMAESRFGVEKINRQLMHLLKISEFGTAK